VLKCRGGEERRGELQPEEERRAPARSNRHFKGVEMSFTCSDVM